MTAAKFEDSHGPRAFALAMAETDLGIAFYDGRNTLLFWNERCRVLSGYPYDLFFTGSRLEDHVAWSARQGFFGAGDPDVLTAERMAALAAPGVQELYFFRPTGEPVVLRCWRHLDGTLLCVTEERLDYRNFVAAAREGFVIGDHQGRIAVVNPGAEALFGYSRSELYGRPLDMLFAGTVGIAELWRRGHQGQERTAFSEPIALSGVRKRGGHFAAEVSIVGVESRGSQILGLIVRDVTAKARAEEALKESRAALERQNQEHDAERRRMERLTKAGHWGWTNDPARPGMMDAPISTSESFLAICGLPANAKLTMRSFLERVVHPADREQLHKSWMENLGIKTTAIDAFRIVRPDGEIRWVYDMIDPVRDASGHLVGDNATLLDVTEIKRTEAALQRQQTLLLSMERISGVGGWEFDPGENRMIWTEGLFFILGRSREAMEPSAENYLACVHADDREFVRAQFEGALRGEASAEAEYRIVRSGGEERIVSARIEVLRDEKRRVRRVVGAVADRTEARRTEAALRQSQRLEAVGHLTGGIAHDFNNLLGVITGNLELLLENPGIDAKTQRLAKRAVDGARHGAELTKRLLAFSRRQSLWPRNVDLNELLARMVGMLERTLGERIAVDVRPAVDLWPCRVDPAQINDTILNLAINARDAMPKGGRLILATENVRLDESYAAREADIEAGDYVSLSVSDSGVGMAPEVLARAFEPFYTTKEEGKGTGLGLSMVWGFVKQSKGHIRIYSEVGRGTTVRIYLPRATSDDARETEPAQLPRDLPRGSETVLVVEDNERLRRIAVEQLESLGYAVLEAENAEAALVLLAAHPEVALVYSDIVMSGPMTGYDLAREASRRYPQLKVLLATGYASQSLALPKPEDNDFTVLHKPVALRELASRVRGELEKGASRQPIG